MSRGDVSLKCECLRSVSLSTALSSRFSHLKEIDRCGNSMMADAKYGAIGETKCFLKLPLSTGGGLR